MRRLLFLGLCLVTLSAGCGGGTSPSGDAGGADTGASDASSDTGTATDSGTSTDAAMTDATTTDAAPAPDASTDACGGCPSGTSCGSANGLPVCRTATGIPRFGHVFVVVMENTSLSTLTAATNTPYLTSLFADRASSSNYHGVAHPSLPNYLAMTSGMDVSSIGCDCEPMGSACGTFNCNAVLHSCGCPQSISHLGDQLEAASLGWKAYGEDMGSPCNMTSSGRYVARHVPFLYYDDVQSDAARCAAHVVDYGGFAGDLASGAPTFSFIVPNLQNDMHDPITGGSSNLAHGDTWLSSNLPFILASPAYTGGGLLIVVWDEDDLSGVLAPDDPIGLIVLSPYAKQGGYMSTAHGDHSSLLATIEDGLGLARLGTAASATPLADFFPAM